MEDARLFFRTKARVENMTMTMGPVHEWRTQVREGGVGVRCRLVVLAEADALLPCGRGVVVVQAKLAVAPLSKWGGCVIGLYEEGSHRVAPMPRESARLTRPTVAIHSWPSRRA